MVEIGVRMSFSLWQWTSATSRISTVTLTLFDFSFSNIRTKQSLRMLCHLKNCPFCGHEQMQNWPKNRTLWHEISAKKSWQTSVGWFLLVRCHGSKSRSLHPFPEKVRLIRAEGFPITASTDVSPRFSEWWFLNIEAGSVCRD